MEDRTSSRPGSSLKLALFPRGSEQTIPTIRDPAQELDVSDSPHEAVASPPLYA